MDVGNREPIAVIGIAYKFPQGAVDDESFWKMLVERRCASTEYPKDRLNIDAFHSPNKRKHDRISTRRAHFLEEDTRAFDAPFFSIPPSEAMTMDPQQRGLMETTFHAFENAGLSLQAIAASNTSVHVGCFTSDFMMTDWRDTQQIPQYSATGSASSILANRISWFFDLRGPSMVVDTACSSSMIALDAACNGLLMGTSATAVVAGVNLISSVEMNIALSKMSFLSPGGRCQSFDHRADGYARGEGFGVLILKPASQAVKDRDHIRALIRSTGTNQDGRTIGGLTQPSKDQQAQLIRETYQKADLSMVQTRFFEAHGTGTAIGDPIEAQAVGECFKQSRSPDDPLFVGAVKSNIGHLEGSSGVAGIIKTILALEKGVIPPNTNFELLNPNIDAEFFNLEFPQRCIPWKHEGIRRASVNSFGYGGSNAHAIIDNAHHFFLPRGLAEISEEALEALKNSTKAANDNEIIPKGLQGKEDDHHVLLTFSSADESGTARLADLYSRHLKEKRFRPSPTMLGDLAFTLNVRRSQLPWKAFAVVNLSSLEDLNQMLSNPVKAEGGSVLGFAFTGQGAQWFGMGRELLSVPKFMESIDLAQDCLTDLGGKWKIVDELSKCENASRVSEPELSQMLSTVIQIALVELYEWLGVKPEIVVGHSSGEIAAAYCAGHLSRQSALKVAYHRGRCVSKLTRSRDTSNTMLFAGISQCLAANAMEDLGRTQETGFDRARVTCSCINSPNSVTLSGPVHELDLLASHFQRQGVFAQRLNVNVAYHSPQMQLIADEYHEAIGTLEEGPDWRSGKMMSSVSCNIITGVEVSRSDYWVRNLVSPVQFAEAMRLCCFRKNDDTIVPRLDRSHRNDIVSHFWLEIGPHAALQRPIKDTLKSVQREKEVHYCSALIRRSSALITTLEAVGLLWTHNIHVDMEKALELSGCASPAPRVLTDLPRYPFNHSVLYWEESLANRAFRFSKHATHPLAGALMAGSSALEARWKFVIRLEELPWARDHEINGLVLYPAAGMLIMAIQATHMLTMDRRGLEPLGFEVKDAEFLAPISLSAGRGGVETLITLWTTQDVSDEYKFQILVCQSETETFRACQGTVRADYERTASDVDGGRETEAVSYELRREHQQIANACDHSVGHADLYRQLKDIGLNYGPAFQSLDDVRCNDRGKATASVVPFTWCEGSATAVAAVEQIIHPSTLDGFFHLAFAALSQNMSGIDLLPTMVPSRIGKIWISSKGAGNSNVGSESVSCEAHMITPRLARCSMSVKAREAQTCAIRIQCLELTAVSKSQDMSQSHKRPDIVCQHLSWKVDPRTLGNRQLFSHCELTRQKQQEPVEWFADLERLTLVLGGRALLELMISHRQVAEPYKKYVSWLHHQITHQAATMTSMDASGASLLGHHGEDLSDFIDRMRKSCKRGELYARIGQKLCGVLLGEVDPLEMMFGNDQLMPAFYGEVIASSTAFDAISTYLDMLVHAHPDMKFLEIGAGTGATTSRMLETLDDPCNGQQYAEYVFTDLSPSFFEHAQSQFASYKRVTYRCLDIEQDPFGQGFALEAYDVVVASMVLHATADLTAALKNVRRLLKPGGKLVLVELIAPGMTWTGFIFGLLPGWWHASEGHRRLSPCVTEEEWHTALLGAGFSGTDMTFHDYRAKTCRGWSVMVSSAIERVTPEPLITPATVLLSSRSASQMAGAEYLARIFREKDSSVDIMTLSEVSTLKDIHSRNFILIGDFEQSILRHANSEIFSNLQALMVSAKYLLWVTPGAGEAPSSPDHGFVDGLCRVSRHENESVPLVKLALKSNQASLTSKDVAQIVKAYSVSLRNVGSTEFEPEYLEVNGLLHINRTAEARSLNQHIFTRTARPVILQQFGSAPNPLKLNVRVPGLLDSMEFVEDDSANNPLAPNEILVEVHAIGLNFKDCLTALGRVDGTAMGSDCAGIVSRVGDECGDLKPGDRVLTCSLDTFRTFARARSHQVVRLPDEMPFTEAASLPTAFLTAYHSLHVVAHLQNTESILIHAAAGGTGQAAVQIAQQLGAEVFAAVGSLVKKDLLMQVYKIPEDHIFYSRDTSFADGIRRVTRGRGVDVVLSSLSGEGLIASWNCVAPFGRLVEIGQRDAEAGRALPMGPFRRGASFHGVHLASIFPNRELMSKMMGEIMALVRRQAIQPPQPLQIYTLTEIEKAFRYLLSGKSLGKIVVEVNRNAMAPIVQGPDSAFTFDESATYVIAGGFGGIGRTICRWLVERGAKHLLILSRRGPLGNEKAAALLDWLHARGVSTQCPPCDICSLKSLIAVLQECSLSMPAIKGCFQASMVLKDTIFGKMTFEDWSQSTRPKVQGSWNLHRALPEGMDFFILLSSVCGIVGNGGQSNYAAGNTYQDALAEFRRAQGEKAISLDLGVILSEGYVAENEEVMDRLNRVGLFLPIPQNKLLALFDYYCDPKRHLPRLFEANVITGLELPANMIARGADIPIAQRQPLFRQMHQIEASEETGASTSTDQAQDTVRMFKEAKSSEEAVELATAALQEKLAKMLGLPPSHIQLERRIESIGVDSLVAVELRNWLVKVMGADVAVFEIIGGATVAGLGETVAGKSTFFRPS